MIASRSNTKWIFVLSFFIALISYKSTQAQFVTTWKTDNPGISGSNQITIGAGGTGLFYNVSWQLVGNPAINGTVNNINTPSKIITFPAPGTYQVSITGTFPQIIFGGNLDGKKLLTVEAWGNNPWTSMFYAFGGCSNLTINASDAPNLTNVTSVQQMFEGASSLNSDLTNWDVSNITNMSYMFTNASSFNGNITSWDVSSVTDMSAMFFLASSFNRDISGWDVSNVTITYEMFRYANSFNTSIDNWNVSNVTDMRSMFSQTASFNQSLNSWNVGQVTDMSNMFEGAVAFNADISNWNVSNVNNMYGMFQDAGAFNQDISSWNVGACTYAPHMFHNALSFNSDISNWNVSTMTDMSSMFEGASSFNQDVGLWNVFNVTYMYAMFSKATIFNQNLDGWDVSNVTNMNSMFYQATDFNGSVGPWNVSNVTDMATMFHFALAFNQDLFNWNISAVTDMTSMFDNSGLSNTNYDNLLNAWAALPVQTGVIFGASTNTYCLGEAARATLIASKSWSITDAGKLCPLPFITTWKTNDNQINIPAGTGTFNYSISWTNLTNVGVGNGSDTGQTGNYTINGLANGDIYQVEILGTFPHFRMGGNTTEGPKLLSIKSWGSNVWGSMEQAFHNCNNLIYNATDTPNLSNVADMSYMFANCGLFNGDVSGWDTSTVTNMSYLFSNNFVFNKDINSWNVSNVTDMSFMFTGDYAFNQNLNSWDVGNVTNMEHMFQGISIFNGNITNWNVSGVTNMAYMFNLCQVFNQDIGGWNVGNATNMESMFSYAYAFNRNLNSWDVTNVANMANLFSYTDFNYPLDNWNVSNVTQMNEMFISTPFNQDISSWDVSNVTDMRGMFNATPFNQDISGWTVDHVTDMSWMFAFASDFDQNINSWNVSNVTTMQGMFYSAKAFKSPLNNWNVSSVTQMNDMFGETQNFNQPLDNWNVSHVTSMSQMFYLAPFNQDISGWNVENVTNMHAMFANASAFNQNLATWNVQQVTDMTFLFYGSGLSNANYDNILIGWAGLPSLQADVTLDAPDNTYCLGESARNTIIATFNWIFNDAGTYCALPTIASFLPTNAASGATVVITGTNLFNATSVRFGGTPAASFVVNSATQITAVVGSGATGSVDADTPGGNATQTGFTFIPTPTISSFTPTSAGPGLIVIITGTNLSGTTAVSFGATPAASFINVNATTVSAVVAGGASGSISLTNPGGTATLGGFTFVPTPTISSFTPTSGGPGSTVTITGTDFTGATDVSFGGTAASSFTVSSATSITAVVANGTSGSISVTTPGGTATRAGFSFIPAPTMPAPAISSFTPATASTGQTITITGTNLSGATAVTFGGTAAASFIIVSSTSITAVVANGTSGSISVTTSGGTASRPGFSFIANTPPVITDGEFTTQVEGMLTIELSALLQDADNNIDLSTVNIVSPPISGAVATINSSLELRLDYTGIFFSGKDRLTIAVCDLLGACGQNEITIDVEGDIIVYNGISPNGDGLNDFFKLQYIDVLQETKNNKVSIFNRWGDEVFASSDYNNTSHVFTGLNMNGNELPSGVYFYKIEFTGAHPEMTGYLTLSR